jgi:purine nucleosidase
MFRSPWFWIVVALIAAGVALTAALGVLIWLIAAIAVAILAVLAAFLFAAYAVGRAEPLQVTSLRQAPAVDRIPVILDCDVTTGCLFREVSGGLALLYLLGEPCVDLLCVTATYGNGPVDLTRRTTRRLLDDVGRGDMPVLPGASGPNENAEENGASRHLVEAVCSRPGEIALLATGSLTNLKHAAALDPDFFRKLRGLYLMGGVTEPLVWNERRLAELNFTLDPEAAYQALHAECPVTVATGQAGLTAIFRRRQLAALQTLGDPVSRLIARQVRPWFALMRLYFQDGGFAMWDSVTALALTHPELFDFEQAFVTSTRDDLRTGRLILDCSEHGPVRVVRSVRDYDSFITAHFAAWHHLGQRIARRNP